MTNAQGTSLRVKSSTHLSRLFVLLFALTAAVSAAAADDLDAARDNKHVIRLSQRVLSPEDGLLLGNGDLSVSVYQTADRIIWRFGKGDVWDRRLDLSDDPKPAHIDEIAHGIEVEGWKCGPYGGPVEATHGTDNPERMQELCQGTPPSYMQRPYPCPKAGRRTDPATSCRSAGPRESSSG